MTDATRPLDAAIRAACQPAHLRHVNPNCDWPRCDCLAHPRGVTAALTYLAAHPDPAVIEAMARARDPSSWRKIDRWVEEDSWNGGTALNLRDQLLTAERAAYDALFRALLGE